MTKRTEGDAVYVNDNAIKLPLPDHMQVACDDSAAPGAFDAIMYLDAYPIYTMENGRKDADGFYVGPFCVEDAQGFIQEVKTLDAAARYYVKRIAHQKRAS